MADGYGEWWNLHPELRSGIDFRQFVRLNVSRREYWLECHLLSPCTANMPRRPKNGSPIHQYDQSLTRGCLGLILSAKSSMILPRQHFTRHFFRHLLP